MEIGTLYAKLGSKVTFVEALPTILPGSDPECVQVVARKAKKLGMEILLGAKAKGLAEKGERRSLTVETKDGAVELPADKVLVAVGRRPNIEDLGLEIAGVKTAGGFITVDRQMRTSVPNIFAIGDVAGQPMLAHKASREAEVAAEVIAEQPAAMDAAVIPAVVFTDPEIASAGLTAEEAEQRGHKVKVGKFPFTALGPRHRQSRHRRLRQGGDGRGERPGAGRAHRRRRRRRSHQRGGAGHRDGRDRGRHRA